MRNPERVFVVSGRRKARAPLPGTPLTIQDLSKICQRILTNLFNLLPRSTRCHLFCRSYGRRQKRRRGRATRGLNATAPFSGICAG